MRKARQGLERFVVRYGRLPIAGAVALTLSLVGAGGAAWTALQLDPAPAPVARARERTAETERDAPVEVGDRDPGALLDRNPFHPERRRSSRRFQLPVEEPEGRDGTPAPGTLRLTGTILYPDGGGAAIVKQGGQPSQIVRRGAAIGALTLSSVERGKATFTTSDGSPVVLVSSEEGGS